MELNVQENIEDLDSNLLNMLMKPQDFDSGVRIDWLNGQKSQTFATSEVDLFGASEYAHLVLNGKTVLNPTVTIFIRHLIYKYDQKAPDDLSEFPVKLTTKDQLLTKPLEWGINYDTSECVLYKNTSVTDCNFTKTYANLVSVVWVNFSGQLDDDVLRDLLINMLISVDTRIAHEANN